MAPPRPAAVAPAPRALTAYRRVLVPLDGSPETEQALAVATALAGGMGATLVLLQPVGRTQEIASARRSLGLHADRLAAEGLPAVTVVRLGRPAQAILAEADGGAVDLIVMATPNRGWLGRLVHGTSVAEEVRRHARVPVVLVHGGHLATPALPDTAPLLIVVLDGPTEGKAALPVARAVARSGRGRLLLLQVLPMPLAAGDVFRARVARQRAALAREAQKLAGDGLQAEAAVEFGPVADVVLDQARKREAALILVATTRRPATLGWRTEFEGLADSLARRGSCPVAEVSPVA